MTQTHASLSRLIFTLCLCWGITAQAQSKDAVLVLSHGGLDAIDQLDLQQTPEGPTVIQGKVRLFAQGTDPKVINDLRVLPDGQLLTAGIDRNRIVQFDPLDISNTLIYRHNTRSEVKSVSVVTYSAFGTPRRVMFTDDTTSVVSIYDQQSDAMVWRQSLFITGGQTEFSQAILLPNARIAIATNWTSLNLFAIDIVELAPGQGPSLVRFANTTNIDNPDQTFIREELDQLRDLYAIDADTLLVTTRYKVFAMTTSGDILWEINMADDLEFGGEFSSARMTLNNTLVLATFEPGVWVQPHPNHKIHWFTAEANTPKRFAKSGPLQRAPKRIEPSQSTGGTGTLNYRAGLQDVGQGELSDLEITQALRLSNMMPKTGETLTMAFIVKNAGNAALTLKRMAVLGTEGNDCDAPGQPTRPIYEETEVIIEPDTELGLAGDVILNEMSLLRPGQWCVQAAVQDAQDEWRIFAPRIVITVLDDEGNAKPITVPKRDLRLSTPDMPADLGQLDMDMGAPNPTPPTEDGCGCRQVPNPAPSIPIGLCLGLGLFVGVYRRMR